MNISNSDDVSDCDSVSDDGFNCDEGIKDFIKELKQHIKILEKENTKLRQKCNVNLDEKIYFEIIKNKEIIKSCKMKMVSLKTRFDELERIIILNNCNDIIINSSNYDINNPIYPISPYKI